MKNVKKLIDVRNCLRKALSRLVIEHPNTSVDKELHACLVKLEQLIISEIKEKSPPSDGDCVIPEDDVPDDFI